MDSLTKRSKAWGVLSSIFNLLYFIERLSAIATAIGIETQLIPLSPLPLVFLIGLVFPQHLGDRAKAEDEIALLQVA